MNTDSQLCCYKGDVTFFTGFMETGTFWGFLAFKESLFEVNH